MTKSEEQFTALAEQLATGWPVLNAAQEEYSVPYFGKILTEWRDVNGAPTSYHIIQRTFGWSVVVGLTVDREVVTLAQWKPGVNQASWELPPGGIGKLEEDAPLSLIQERTREAYVRETGYDNSDISSWRSLGAITIESGKYRGATPESHGLFAHLWLASGLRRVQEPQPASNEIYRLILVPFQDFPDVLDGGRFIEASAVAAAERALRRINK